MNVHFKAIKLNYKLISLFMAIILIISCIYICNYSNASEPEGIKVPIIMYHSILKDPSKQGKYIVSPTVLENDFKYLQEKGYSSITMNDLINYVYEDTPLPEKPVIITFDDGDYNNYTYAVPLLEKYNMRAVISIVGKFTDTYTISGEVNPNYSYLRWEDIQKLTENGIIEFANHTYDLHNNTSRKGCMKKINESLEDYTTLLTNDIMKLQQEFFFYTHSTPKTFTYPFGGVSKLSCDIIKNLGFKASLSCKSGINYITKDPECLYLLKRNNRPAGKSTSDFFKLILDE